MNDSLEPLLGDSPRTRQKVLAAWDGLSIESQIWIVSELEKRRLALSDELIEKALQSPNAYLRYLISRRSSGDPRNEREIAIQARIDQDESGLVRYASEESRMHGLDPPDAKDFSGYPQDQKLAVVGSEWPPSGEKIAAWVAFELAREATPIDDIAEVISEYVRNPRLFPQRSWRSDDGSFEYHEGRSLEALWKLVSTAPSQISSQLVTHLPTKAGLFTLPEETVATFEDWQLFGLFQRSHFGLADVGLGKIRNRLFFAHPKEMVRRAAASANMDFTDDDFRLILQSRKELADELALADVPLVYLAAVGDRLKQLDSGFRSAARSSFDQRVKKIRGMTGWQVEREFDQVRLYQLARNAMARQSSMPLWPEKALSFLRDCIVPGDTWATYMAFEAKEEKGEDWLRVRHWLPDYSETGIEGAEALPPDQKRKRDEDLERWGAEERGRAEATGKRNPRFWSLESFLLSLAESRPSGCGLLFSAVFWLVVLVLAFAVAMIVRHFLPT